MRDQRFSPPNLLKASALHFHHIAIPRYHGHAAPLRGILPSRRFAMRQKIHRVFLPMTTAPSSTTLSPAVSLPPVNSPMPASSSNLTKDRAVWRGRIPPSPTRWRLTAPPSRVFGASSCSRQTWAGCFSSLAICQQALNLKLREWVSPGIPVLLSMRSVYRDFGEVDLIDSLVAGVQSRIYRYLTLQQPCGRLYWTCTRVAFLGIT